MGVSSNFGGGETTLQTVNRAESTVEKVERANPPHLRYETGPLTKSSA